MKRLGHYELRREIGRGGMASVHEAVHAELGRPVAIKIMLPNLAADPRSARRFLREAKAAASVRHPHVVDIFDVGQQDGIFFLAMELLEGETLAALLARTSRLDLESAIALALPIASAIGHAHTKGVIHRDLKPSNIFLTRGLGGRMHPKVVDFGISKVIEGVSALSVDNALTASESLIGTLAYMAPEQIRDASQVGAHADQYSLAVMLYECVTGRLPFEGTGSYDLMHSILHENPPPPSRIDPALPEAFDEVVLRALSRDPAGRFASLPAFAARLLSFADREACAFWKADFSGGGGPGGSTLDDSGEGLQRPERTFESYAADRAAPATEPARSGPLVLAAATGCVVLATAFWASSGTPRLRESQDDAPTTSARTLELDRVFAMREARASIVEKAGEPRVQEHERREEKLPQPVLQSAVPQHAPVGASAPAASAPKPVRGSEPKRVTPPALASSMPVGINESPIFE
jgi:serine/threonine protein kinase